MAAWADRTMANPAALAISTSAVAFITGLLFGIYSTRGYLISPELAEQRRRNLTDPFESEASDIDEGILLDHAPNWANGEEADVRDGLRAPSIAGSSTSSKKKKKSSKDKDKVAKHTHSHSGDEECKLVLVVRTDLGMTKGEYRAALAAVVPVSFINYLAAQMLTRTGKIAAQCGHATLACYKILRRAAERDPTSSAAKLLQRWERRGQAKIAVQAKGEDTLLTLMGTAHSLGVTAEVIADAGRTQIESGSLTVLGVGPAPKSLVDKITGHLKLL
ncbi:hypothetical protein SEPCBS57363_005000 [Sporothrix epigloea]|uniref:peptidyl-tRNA hydrolase n=1 Tax=Sporothrix epigloea TaxID=1892477 RepID=A0ABP0DV33_9PEZI